MKWTRYLKDRFLYLFSFTCFYFLSLYLFYIFRVSFLCVFLISFFFLFSFLFWFLYDYFKKKHFYDDLMAKLERLPQKYLLVELLERPSFLEGELLYQVLIESDKDMNEHIKTYQRKQKNFKEYLELWVHEIKTPLARCFLLLHQNRQPHAKELEQALMEIENHVDQVLYYARSEVSEKDYYIRKVNLKTIVNKVMVRNQDAFIYRKIHLELHDLDTDIYTDAKWLEFILNQIVQNSLKYCDKEEGRIVISKEIDSNGTKLSIWDNGIGIKKEELPRVFEKSFTGSNGRLGKASTGIGLFICKNLCEKLGHQITIESKQNEYTKVVITFGNNPYYDVIERNE